jgi:predicted protein tyrosine phosphatase
VPKNEFVFNEKSLKIYNNLFIIIYCWANVQRSNAVVVGDSAGVDDANASATTDRHAIERIPYLCTNQ